DDHVGCARGGRRYHKRCCREAGDRKGAKFHAADRTETSHRSDRELVRDRFKGRRLLSGDGGLLQQSILVSRGIAKRCVNAVTAFSRFASELDALCLQLFAGRKAVVSSKN